MQSLAKAEYPSFHFTISLVIRTVSPTARACVGVCIPAMGFILLTKVILLGRILFWLLFPNALVTLNTRICSPAGSVISAGSVETTALAPPAVPKGTFFAISAIFSLFAGFLISTVFFDTRYTSAVVSPPTVSKLVPY